MKSKDRCVTWWKIVMIMEWGNIGWEGVTVVRECDSHQGGVKGIRNVW